MEHFIEPHEKPEKAYRSSLYIIMYKWSCEVTLDLRRFIYAGVLAGCLAIAKVIITLKILGVI